MGKCVEKLPHQTEKCNSRDGLQVFLKEGGGYDGYCFSCGTYVPDPYADKPVGYTPVIKVKSEEDIQRELAEIGGYGVHALTARKLRREYLEYFGVKIGVSETDGETPHSVYFPYTKEGNIVAYKARLLAPKTMWAVGAFKGVDLFGWEQAIATGAKRLFVTEGEFDAIAVFQIIKESSKGTAYADFNPAVVSVQNGAGGASASLVKAADEIRKRFKEVVLVFDNDAAGKEAIEKVLRVIPEAVVATLPSKDANDCIKEGKVKAAFNAIQFNSAKPKNTRLVKGSDLHEAAKKAPEFGVSWPWKHITEKTRGIRLGETIYIGAGQKQGKSEIVNTLAAHFIREHGWKVFLAKPEEGNNKTYKMVAGKMEGKFFHDPKVPFDYDAYDRAGNYLKDNLYVLNLYQDITWEVLSADIRAAAAEGCKAIIIDPITNLVNGMESGAANTKLQEIAQKLAAMAIDLQVVIFIFCHLRNPDSGPPHERGGEVLSSQFAGSRAMARSCNLMLGLEGNRDPNLPEDQRNLRTLVLLEDREFGETGRFGLYWDNKTGLFNEI